MLKGGWIWFELGEYDQTILYEFLKKLIKNEGMKKNIWHLKTGVNIKRVWGSLLPSEPKQSTSLLTWEAASQSNLKASAVAGWLWERLSNSWRWSYSRLSASLIHHTALARMQEELIFPPSHLGGPAGRGGWEQLPAEGQQKDEQKRAVCHTGRHKPLSSVPLRSLSINPKWQGTSEKWVCGITGPEKHSGAEQGD